MRACVQRVTSASVDIAGERCAQIERGLVVLLAVAHEDDDRHAAYLAEKLTHLRVFEDEAGKMNRSLIEVRGQMLVVSQFTLLADCRKGRRPSFVGAAAPIEAERLYELVVAEVRKQGIEVATGQFRAHMRVSLANDGPVTLLLDTSGAV